MATVKQTKTITGTTSSSTWTWKQVITESWNDDYLTTNKSIIKVQTYMGRSSNSSTASFGGTATTKIICDGTTRSKSQSWNYQSFWISAGGWKLIQEEEFEVTHDADGTKKITISSSLSTTQFVPNSTSASGEITLTTIPRASQIGVTDADIGKTSTITINKMSDSFTTTLFYRIKGATSWTTIVTKTSLQSYAFTVPTSLYSSIPNATTIECEFKADTYSGTTLTGSSDIVTATFTAKGNPVINSSSIVDTNSTTTALTGSSSKIVKYASVVKATIKSTPQNSSTIKSITINGIAATLTTASGVTTGVATISGPSSNVFNIVVTDSRGYSTTTSVTIASSNFINYIPLTISAYSVVRNTPTDGKVNITVSGNYYNGSFGSVSNTLTIQYRYREKGGTWGSWTTISNTNYTYTLTKQLTGLNYQKQYEFELKVIDKVKTLTITGIVVSKGVPIVNWEESFFNVNGELRKNNANIFLSIYPVGSIYISTSSTNPGTLFGGTWSQITDRFLLAAGSSYTAGNTGGAKTANISHTHTTGDCTLTVNQIPSHTHNQKTIGEDGNINPWVANKSGSSAGVYTRQQVAWYSSGKQQVPTYGTGGGAAHNHGSTGSGGSSSLSIMPPYLVVYVWKRTA